TRNSSPRLSNFVADITDVVIAEIIKADDSRRRPQSQETPEREIERVGRKIKGDTSLKIKESTQDHRKGRENSSDPQTNGQLADKGNAAVKQSDIQNAQRHDHTKRLGMSNIFPDVAEILREADVTRSNLQRPAQGELPNKEETHETTKGFAPKPFPQVNI